jgi:hypothetical protein
MVPEPKLEPKIIDPGPPPSDAIVLFDGKGLSKWKAVSGGETKWIVKDGAMEPVKGAGYISTRDEFGDFQLHIEWATPSKVEGSGQGRGNSGVFLHGRYEVQILDSYNNKTYYHGQAAAVYKQYPPLVNASRPPGDWQTYEIIFHGPRFSGSGNVTKRATVTVLHNGVLVQDKVEILGDTAHDKPPKYTAYAGKGPIHLQDHGNPVRFRNIWIREL